MAKTKVCSKCGKRKAIADFHSAQSTKDGRQSHCKKCDNARKTEWWRNRSRALGRQEKFPTLVARELRKEGRKRCPGCKKIKELESFYKSKASRDGYASHCILCAKELGSRRPKEEKSARYQADKLVRRNKTLIKKFGITLDEYNQMHEAQGRVCAICGGKDKNKGLAVDHDHKTKYVRALLCSNCNPAIGFLKEDPKLARKAADYLEHHKKEQAIRMAKMVR